MTKAINNSLENNVEAPKINRTALFALVIYPLMMIAAICLYTYNFGFGFFELTLAVVGYYGANIAVGIGLHRLWSHDSYKTNKYIEFILALFAAATLQGPALSWASNHIDHHRYTDSEKDPHTPLKFKNKWYGFWWSHMGWMLHGNGSYKKINRIAMVKLGRNKILRWQMHYYWQIALIMNTIAPAIFAICLAYIFPYNLVSNSIWFIALQGFLFVGIARAIQQQVTFCVNSACHFIGAKKYSPGTEGNIWWMCFLLLGENYHNFHHAFPSDYRNGEKWYHFDAHKWIIFAMSKLGLASNLKTTPQVRIDAKIASTKAYFHKQSKIELDSLYDKATLMLNEAQKKLAEFDIQAIQFSDNLQMPQIKKSFNQTYALTEKKLSDLLGQMNNYVSNFGVSNSKKEGLVTNKTSKKLLNSFRKQYQQAEELLKVLAYEVDKLKAFSI